MLVDLCKFNFRKTEKVDRVILSMSHSDNYAVANVILERDNEKTH